MSEKQPIKTRTLYIKEGKKYKAVSEEMHVCGWADGFYLVHIKTGGRSTARALLPDYPELECAFKACEEEFIRCLHEASKLRLDDQREQDPKVEKAFEELKAKLGNKLPVYLTYGSLYDILRIAIQKFHDRYQEFKASKNKAEFFEI